MTVENISWSISTKECCRPRQGLNPRPPGLQSDGASNWATETGHYLEVKILSLPKHENLTISKKYQGKEEKLLLRISSLFHNIFDTSLTPRVQLHINLLNVVVWIIFFFNSENLICRGTDILKCFRVSLGIRDNKSWLHYEYRLAWILMSTHNICFVVVFFVWRNKKNV